jgi:hypothetical protein
MGPSRLLRSTHSAGPFRVGTKQRCSSLAITSKQHGSYFVSRRGYVDISPIPAQEIVRTPPKGPSTPSCRTSSHATLLLLRLALPLAAVPRLQLRHAGFAHLGVFFEEGRQRVRLDDGRQLDPLLSLLPRLAVGGSDQDGQGTRRVHVGEDGIACCRGKGCVIRYCGGGVWWLDSASILSAAQAVDPEAVPPTGRKSCWEEGGRGSYVVSASTISNHTPWSFGRRRAPRA